MQHDGSVTSEAKHTDCTFTKSDLHWLHTTYEDIFWKLHWVQLGSKRVQLIVHFPETKVAGEIQAVQTLSPEEFT